MNIDIQHYKAILESELVRLNSELESIGTKDEATGTVWNSVQREGGAPSDREEIAENLDVFENQGNIISILEVEKNEVVLALERIEKGTYGVCEIDGKEIEQERLEANPSAKTCMSCINN